MAETRTTSQEVQGEILDAVRKSQEAVVDAIKRWADTVQSITPSIPVPNLNLPYADKLPKPEELVANAYDFAEQLLATQRSFAESILQAAKPLMPGKNGGTAGTAPKGGSAAK
ncbi:MAG TPA: hypothetical protein VMV92_31275 [Streptosporangiaceae bacterium]|nr:hypothetical protein [Streptosporangiaceae bacterium]